MLNKEIQFLLVEDDQVDVKNVQRAFKKNNIKNPLHIAENGEEAWEMLKGNGKAPLIPSPRIIMLDLNMPKMNGIEFLRKLRQDPELRSLNVFVMTTSDEESDKQATHDLNVAGYIIKPIKMEQFLGAMKTLSAYWTLCEFPKD